MRSKLSIVVRTLLRGVAGEGTGNGGVGYILTGNLVVVVIVVLVVGRVVPIQEGDVAGVVTAPKFVGLIDVLALLFVCQLVVGDEVVVVDSVVISSSI